MNILRSRDGGCEQFLLFNARTLDFCELLNLQSINPQVLAYFLQILLCRNWCKTVPANTPPPPHQIYKCSCPLQNTSFYELNKMCCETLRK